MAHRQGNQAEHTHTHTATMTSTYHTYPNLVYDKGRLAETNWLTDQLSDAIAATLTIDPEAIVLLARIGDESIKGLAPGGLA